MPDRIITNTIPTQLTVVHAYGASLGVGVTITTAGARIANRLTSQLARMLGAASEVNRSVSGSCLCMDNDTTLHDAKPWATTGGWVTICQNDGPGERAEQPLASKRQLAILTPTSDLPAMGPARFESLFPVVLRAVLRRLRAGAVYGHGHSSMSYTGTWTTQTATNKNSGSGYRYTSAEGATSRITVPAHVRPGSKLHAQWIFTHDHRPTLTFTKNGSAAGSIDLETVLAFNTTAGKQRWSPYSHEFTVNPGDVIVTTVSETNLGAARAHFDSYSIEAETPPLVLIFKVARFQNYDLFSTPGAGWTYEISDDDADLAESVINDTVAEFSDVITIDSDPILWDGDTPNTHLYDDPYHPNAWGASLLAAEGYREVANKLSPQRVALTGTT